MSEYNLNTKNINEWVQTLKAGDIVNLSGCIYTARDAAHKRIVHALKAGEELPFELENSVVYYAGPTPAKNGLIIGSVGPTTSSRMDAYSPLLLSLGQKAMIGKGNRSPEVVEAIKSNGAVYFAAIGGAGALYSDCVKECTVVAFEELGCESVKKLRVENFSLIVAIDCEGNSLYK
ncbi:MAG: fumarate hydratase C-terminal domain-containing protein [Clostridia bacterium]|nr:fumarate hydratase C-terminal domain-containing protein [Clostridia bacterium]